MIRYNSYRSACINGVNHYYGCCDNNGNAVEITQDSFVNGSGGNPDACSHGASFMSPLIKPKKRVFVFGRKRIRKIKPMSNFLDISSFTKPKTIVPVIAGAALLGVAGNYAAGKVKLEVLGKYKKPALIVVGVLVGALAGKYLADQMASRQEASNAPVDLAGPEIPSDVSLEVI